MPGHDIIVVGASAGGVEALTKLVQDFPADIPAAIFIVLHLSPRSPSVLPSILSRAGKLPALHPKDGEEIQHGYIYVAPPDFHLIIKPGYVHIARGPRENGHRPAADTLFRTAARAYGQRVVGVVLSGTLDDGTAGLIAIKNQGGIAVVQNPEEALFSGMPRSAIENVAVDKVLLLSEITPNLVTLAHQLIKERDEPVSNDMKMETDMAELEINALQEVNRPGTPSGFGCPDCGGVLWELQENDMIRFRCRVGHAWSADSLLAEQSEALEEALWTALRALEESAALSLRLARRARDRKQDRMAERFEEEAKEIKQRATTIQKVLLNDKTTLKLPEDEPAHYTDEAKK